MEENKSHAEKYDFQHGYTSGLESVDKNNYEGYLSSQVNFEWLDKQLQEQKQELNKLEEKIAHAKSAYKSAFDALQDRVLKVGLAGKNKERLESALFEIDEKSTNSKSAVSPLLINIHFLRVLFTLSRVFLSSLAI
ncbi:hypothetical protein BWI92_08135 [Flectobacillus sp. BAB-3569]|nr:hypothetical protein BWI92_08135 [Flectobacillus sp. BAB-3569]